MLEWIITIAIICFFVFIILGTIFGTGDKWHI